MTKTHASSADTTPATASGDASMISPQALKTALHDGQEIALLDVRETGVYTYRHLLFAVSAPAWRLEMLIDRLVPRRSSRVVLVDADQSLAPAAARKLSALGWTDVSVLAGGIRAWEAAGFELFEGTNVPSKAFGEVIEHQKHTPWIDVDELQSRIEAGENIVVVDSRTPEEYRQFTLPYSHSLPGGELVLRIQEIAPDPNTLIVVNCAGRTRSIVGAQTLIDAGVPNKVVSLKDGTMAWLLSGRELARGRTPVMPEPGPQSLATARERAAAVAAAAGVRRLDHSGLVALQAEQSSRSLYCFDVRTREEYQAGHLEGWRWAPGGQLVQATDEYLATRRARVVLCDWDGVRALTTGAWLAQLGGHEVYVYTPAESVTLVTGPEPVRILPVGQTAPSLSPVQAKALIDAGQAVVFDVDRRAAYEQRHVQGARFCVPDRLESFLESVAAGQTVLITSPDGVLARLIAAQLMQRTRRDVRAIAGGTSAWAAAGLACDSGSDRVLTGDDDSWYSPYAHKDLAARDQAFRHYLSWEIGLVEQLEREGEVGMQLIAAR